MRALSVGTFFQVDGGMDSPWRDLAAQLDVRTGVTVERVSPVADGVEIVSDAGTDRYDAAIVAVPAPIATRIVAPDALPPEVARIEYAPHVRVYLARRGPGIPRSGIHAFPNETVATVEMGAGGDGSWGRVPPGWEWALLCAPAAASDRLLTLSDEALTAELWEAGSRIDSRLFPLESAEIVHIVRWEHAVPKVGVGYLAEVDAIRQRPPIVFAGDWLVQPCVEGAVRSGLAAAAVFETGGAA
jgi:oxygen-dependent protoporphyrinogen oxidase